MAFIDVGFAGRHLLRFVHTRMVLGPRTPLPTLAPMGKSSSTPDRLISHAKAQRTRSRQERRPVYLAPVATAPLLIMPESPAPSRPSWRSP